MRANRLRAALLGPVLAGSLLAGLPGRAAESSAVAPTPDPGEAAAVAPTATVTPDPTPTPRPEGVGAPVVFRGECTRGGGASACRVVAIGVATGSGIRPLDCPAGSENAIRERIEKRYFEPGTRLDLYVRGAPTGSFVVGEADAPSRGCAARARGRRIGAPGHTYDFVALLPEDPVKLSAIRLPNEPQPWEHDLAVKALAGEKTGATAEDVRVRDLRRLKAGGKSVMILRATAADTRAILIAEGTGRDAEDWKIVWSELSDPEQPPVEIVDVLDLDADDVPDLLLERIYRGAPSEWRILRRTDDGWK